jgi:hypothetical protein
MSAECSNACRALGYDGALSYGMVRQYVKTRGWGVWQAFREVVQNALDEMQYVLNDWPKGYVCYNTPTESIVHDWGRGLSIRHLLVGTSEKPEWSRGRFGEGLKLALMVLLDQGVPVYIRSGDREIRPTFTPVNIEGTNLDVFCVCYKKVAETIEGTEVHIGDPTLCRRFMNNFVQGLPVDCRAYTHMERKDSTLVWWGHILDCDEARGKIYVRDIYVRDMPALFGYNVFNVKLSESRDVASEYDIRHEIEILWSNLMLELGYERMSPGSLDPQVVKSWTDLLMGLIDGALRASMSGGNEVETELYPSMIGGLVSDLVTDLFKKLYGEYAVVVTTPDMLEFARYIGMNPVFFCTTPFCRWLFHVTKTVGRMSEKVGKATATVPKDKLPAPLKCIIDDLEMIAYYITTDYIIGHRLIVSGQIEYGYLQENVCGQTETKPSTRIILSIPCLMRYCVRNTAVEPGENAVRCIQNYLSTLLHELAHAVSGAADGNTDFERELTELLGIASTNGFMYYSAIKEHVNNIIAKIGQPCE